MKKTIILALILSLVAGGTIVFADNTDSGAEKMEQNRPAVMGTGDPNGQGIPEISSTVDEAVLDILDLTADELKELIKEGKTLAEIAEEEGVLDELKDALSDVQKEHLDALVEEEKITEEQAEEMLEKYQKMLDEDKLGMMGFTDRDRRTGPDMNSEHQEIILDILGITSDEFKELREEGKTLSEIAEDEEILDEIKDALYDAQKERLNTLVDKDKLTEDHAEEMLEKYRELLDEDKLIMGGFVRRDRRGSLGISSERQEMILDILDMTSDEFKELREEGKTLVEIAEDEGVLDEIKDALYDAQKERLNALVDKDKLTEDHVEEMLKKYRELLDEDKFRMIPQGGSKEHKGYRDVGLEEEAAF